MKANQVRIKLNPETGRLWLFKAIAGKVKHQPIADVTNDVMQLFAMDAIVRENREAVQQEIELTFEGKVHVVQMTLQKIGEREIGEELTAP